MKQRIVDTVNLLLQQSGQSVPAKILTIDENSVQVYDVEHWPETFNSLLLHDTPSLVISTDSSNASVSGFVVTLHWNPPVDISKWFGSVMHCLVVFVMILVVTRCCVEGMHQLSLDDTPTKIRELYLRGAGGNATARDFGAYAPSSLLAEQLRFAIRDL
jgi:hypothetical protein